MKSTIEGVVVYPINKHEDDRGWLAELFRHDCLEVFNFPAMAYVSMTKFSDQGRLNCICGDTARRKCGV
jgi:dTDP-4-dehydrorhamnose 3,5-epimerase-like enzyme